ncbi:transposase [Kribbella orskensis]|uniref:transposase n=1 Tax=Kribbella orskensis TaxID=2512216 RepID=UPI003F70FD07
MLVSRDVVSDKAWAVIGPLFPAPKATGRPPVDRRTVVEATAWRFRTGAPWRDLPERFGNWAGHGCASAASPRRSRNVTTRSPTAASGPGGRSTSVTSSGSGTGAATS